MTDKVVVGHTPTTADAPALSPHEQHTTVRTLARELLGPDQSHRLRAPEGQPPKLTPGPAGGWQCVGLSHTRTGVAAVLATCPVGVDIESEQRRVNHHRIAESCFSTAEQAWLNAQPDNRRKQAFLQLWTVKEAWLKARGKGIEALDDACISPSDDHAWRLPGDGWQAETRQHHDRIITVVWQGKARPQWRALPVR